jgi:hypothetical protein
MSEEVPLSAPLSTDQMLIEKLPAHLRAEGYSLRIQQWYPARVLQLLDYCNRNGLSIETVHPEHVMRFLRGQYLRQPIWPAAQCSRGSLQAQAVRSVSFAARAIARDKENHPAHVASQCRCSARRCRCRRDGDP